MEPNASVKEMQNQLDVSVNILEVGCGEGQNVLYLAKQGFDNIEATTYVFEDEHPGVPKHLHASNKIVARKK